MTHPDAAPAADLIRISDLQVAAIVGILPDERRRTQVLDIALELELDLTEAGRTGDLSHSVDYGAIAEQVRFIVQAGQFRLLETAALALCHYLLVAPPGRPQGLRSARVSLVKPQALGGHGIPSVHLQRRPQQVTFGDDVRGEARLTRIFANPEVGLWRLHRWPAGMDFPGTSGYANVHELAIAEETVLRVYR